MNLKQIFLVTFIVLGLNAKAQYLKYEPLEPTVYIDVETSQVVTPPYVVQQAPSMNAYLISNSKTLEFRLKVLKHEGDYYIVAYRPVEERSAWLKEPQPLKAKLLPADVRNSKITHFVTVPGVGNMYF